MNTDRQGFDEQLDIDRIFDAFERGTQYELDGFRFIPGVTWNVLIDYRGNKLYYRRLGLPDRVSDDLSGPKDFQHVCPDCRVNAVKAFLRFLRRHLSISLKSLAKFES